jgi:MFS family permease
MRISVRPLVVIAGLILFGMVFALNSAVHSFLILAYTDRDKVALNVGIYYMANACGRLAGTILSGWLYQIGVRHGTAGGLVACLAASAVLLVVTFGISFALPRRALNVPNHP